MYAIDCPAGPVRFLAVVQIGAAGRTTDPGRRLSLKSFFFNELNAFVEAGSDAFEGGTRVALPPPAMHKNVELLIGRLATDPKLRRRFAANPEALLRELAERELELSEVELEALAATAPDAFRSFSVALDARLRKASLPDESVSASENSTHAARKDKESPQ